MSSLGTSHPTPLLGHKGASSSSFCQTFVPVPRPVPARPWESVNEKHKAPQCQLTPCPPPPTPGAGSSSQIPSLPEGELLTTSSGNSGSNPLFTKGHQFLELLSFGFGSYTHLPHRPALGRVPLRCVSPSSVSPTGHSSPRPARPSHPRWPWGSLTVRDKSCHLLGQPSCLRPPPRPSFPDSRGVFRNGSRRTGLPR